MERPKASLYVWARVPEGYTSAQFAERLLDEQDVLVSASSGYGKYGEGYVRLSITASDEDVEDYRALPERGQAPPSFRGADTASTECPFSPRFFFVSCFCTNILPMVPTSSLSEKHGWRVFGGIMGPVQ